MLQPAARWSHRYAGTLILFSIAVLGGCATAGSGPDSGPNVVAMDSTRIGQQLAGKKTVQYIVVYGGGIQDSSGDTIPLKEIPAFLAKTKPDKDAYYVLWLSDRLVADAARDTIKQFEVYGASKFVVRMNKEIAPVADESADSKSKPKKTLLVAGIANPKALGSSDTPPDVSGRPEALRPGKILRQVRYRFASDADVIRGADEVTRLFLASTPSEPASYFDRVTLLDPGAWARMLTVSKLVAAKPLSAKIPFRGRTLVLEGRILQESDEFAAAIASTRKLIADNGGGDLRAMSSEDMLQWWPFIGFDIEEPIFVLETKRHAHRFVIGMNHDKVFIIDDLNGLPPL